MKNISGKELCKVLKQNGWELKRIQESHYILMLKPEEKKEYQCLFTQVNPLKIGLLNKLIKIAGI